MGQDKTPVVTTKYGQLRGEIEDGLYVFKGVPYAAPPAGDRRWLPPEPPEPWKGIRTARNFGPVAPQPAMPPTIIRGDEAPEPQSEDCLFLNIWSPELNGPLRPVMVWIHGGGFNMGSGSSPMHPGDTLARRGRVVIVTINYRLGPLGFLHLNSITGGRIPNTGNEGLLDQIAALRWVQENIAFFGGDPGNVTVFGESAGAMSIGCLLAMPRARGLFQKAILQSGASTVRPLDFALKTAGKYLEILGIKPQDTTELRDCSTDRLIAAQVQLFGKTFWSMNKGALLEPVTGEETLPELPLDAVSKGSAGGVILLAGSNREEARMMMLSNRGLAKMDEAGLVRRLERYLPAERVPEFIAAYRNSFSKQGLSAGPAEILTAVLTDLQFRIPAVRLIEAQRARGIPAYSYIFDWKSPVPGLGACHALDVGFTFGRLAPEFHGSGPAAERLARNMQDAWIAFARSGNPGCEGLDDWPEYGEKRKTMILGENCHVEEAPYEEERLVWEKVPNGMLG